MKKNCTRNPSTSQVSKSYHPNPVTFPYPPDPGKHVLETSSAPTTLVERDKLDLSSVIPPKGEMESPFSWTCPFKSSTSSTLCFGEPTLGKLNQETDFYMTKHMPKPSSGANRVSVSHSSLVTKNGEHFYGENFIHDFPMLKSKLSRTDRRTFRPRFRWEMLIHIWISPRDWKDASGEKRSLWRHKCISIYM